MTEYIQGIDLSRWQPGPNDFGRVLASGRTWGVQRWGAGTYRDPKRVEHIAGMLNAGMLAGAYHVLAEHIPAVEQARAFVREVQATFGTGPLLYVLDAETSDAWGSPQGPACRAFLSEVTQLTQRPTVAYIPRWYMHRHRWPQAVIDSLTPWPWWQSQYPANPQLDDRPPSAGSWPVTFWQYSSRGRVPGIPGNCDEDVFYGSPAALFRIAGGGTPPRPRPPQEDELGTLTSIDSTAFEQVKMLTAAGVAEGIENRAIGPVAVGDLDRHAQQQVDLLVQAAVRAAVAPGGHAAEQLAKTVAAAVRSELAAALAPLVEALGAQRRP